MESIFESVVLHIAKISHLPASSFDSLLLSVTEYLVDNVSSDSIARFISILTFMLSCFERLNKESPLLLPILRCCSFLQQIITFPPLPRLIASSHSDSPDSTLMGESFHWLEIEQLRRNSTSSACVGRLLSLLRSSPSDVPVITYDLLLLSVQSPRFLPLCDALTQMMPMISAQSTEEWLVICPSVLPPNRSLKQVIASRCVLLLLHHLPSERQRMAGFLPFCGSEERFDFLRWVLGSGAAPTDALNLFITMYACRREMRYRNEFNRYFTERRIDDGKCVLEEIESLRSRCAEEMKPFVDRWLLRNRFLLQCTETKTVYEQACAVQRIRRPRTWLLDGSVNDPAILHLYNVCVSLLRQGDRVRCCVVWSQLWSEDVLMAADATWVENQLHMLDELASKADGVWRQMVVLDRYVLETWRDLLENSQTVAEVAAMETGGVLYNMQWSSFFQ